MVLRTALVVAFGLGLLLGCADKASPSKSSSSPTASSSEKADPKIAAALAELSPDDRKLAEAQKTCPMTDEPLGSMGVPPKLIIKGEPVFLCCASCKKGAEADPDKTLKAVAEAKAKAKGQ